MLPTLMSWLLGWLLYDENKFIEKNVQFFMKFFSVLTAAVKNVESVKCEPVMNNKTLAFADVRGSCYFVTHEKLGELTD